MSHGHLTNIKQSHVNSDMAQVLALITVMHQKPQAYWVVSGKYNSINNTAGLGVWHTSGPVGRQ